MSMLERYVFSLFSINSHLNLIISTIFHLTLRTLSHLVLNTFPVPINHQQTKVDGSCKCTVTRTSTSTSTSCCRWRFSSPTVPSNAKRTSHKTKKEKKQIATQCCERCLCSSHGGSGRCLWSSSWISTCWSCTCSSRCRCISCFRTICSSTRRI